MSGADVVLVDAGGSNLASLRHAFARLGARVEVSHSARRIRAASHVVLPGVGAAAPGMRRLRARGLADLIGTLTQPVLGICLGMQLLFEHSEEGDTSCLGLIRGRVRKLHAAPGLRVPHMGWNALVVDAPDALLRGVPEAACVYFTHGFAVEPGPTTVARAEHGRDFAAIIRHGNVCGVQFHPERSGAIGRQILHNFLGP